MNLAKILKDYGLTDKQAKVYLASLSTGDASAHQISKVSGLARSTTYEVLDTLKERGLVATYHKKKVKYYHAENPYTVASKAKEKVEMFENALPDFMAIFNSSPLKPSVRFYEGRQNLNVVFKEILTEASSFIGFSSAEDLVKVLGEEYKSFLTKRIKKKISTRLIMRDSVVAMEMKRTGPQELREIKIAPPTFLHHILVLVWNKKVAFLNLGKDKNVMIIESEDASQFFNSTFNFLWSLLPA